MGRASPTTSQYALAAAYYSGHGLLLRLVDVKANDAFVINLVIALRCRYDHCLPGLARAEVLLQVHFDDELVLFDLHFYVLHGLPSLVVYV